MKADSECLIRSAGTGSWGKDWMGVSRAEGQEEEGSRQKKTDAQKPRQEVTHLVQGTRTRPGGLEHRAGRSVRDKARPGEGAGGRSGHTTERGHHPQRTRQPLARFQSGKGKVEVTDQQRGVWAARRKMGNKAHNGACQRRVGKWTGGSMGRWTDRRADEGQATKPGTPTAVWRGTDNRAKMGSR